MQWHSPQHADTLSGRHSALLALRLCQTPPYTMRSFARCVLGSLLCGVVACSGAGVSAESSTTRVEYHTPSGAFEPGCTRSFHSLIPSLGWSMNVTVARENQALPIISSQYPVGTSGASTFDYNYNSAYVPLFDADGKRSDALLVRCQSLINESVPYAVGPSYLVLAQSKPDGSWAELTQADIVFQPTRPYENYVRHQHPTQAGGEALL